MRYLLLFAAVLLAPLAAHADQQMCWLITTTSAQDISAGAVTTAEFRALPGGQAPSATTPNPTYLKVGVDLVDASNGVTNIELSFTASETTGGTFRKTPLCADAAPALTCGAANADWNPATHGKNWWIKPVDWGFPFGKITTTPTGHGANDTVVLTVYGCRE